MAGSVSGSGLPPLLLSAAVFLAVGSATDDSRVVFLARGERRRAGQEGSDPVSCFRLGPFFVVGVPMLALWAAVLGVAAAVRGVELEDEEAVDGRETRQILDAGSHSSSRLSASV